MFNFWHILFPFSYYLTGNFHTRFTLLVNNYSIRWLHCCGTDAEGNKMTMQLKNKAGAAGIQPPPLRIVMIIIIVIINWATVPDEYKTVLSVSHVVTRTECCCLTSNFLWTQQTPPWHCLCMCCWNWFGATMCNEMGVGASSCHDSLIFMSTHKATAARCLSHHQATYGQPLSAWPL